MDDHSFEELDKIVSNIGREKRWTKKIGGRSIVFSPINTVIQTKMDQILGSKEAGPDFLTQTKIIALSGAIVAIDNANFEKYIDAGPVFGITISGKKTFVDLPTYLRNKMANWSSQWIDDAFSVYADCMETYQKENLNDIEFENKKDPIEEHAELMVRITQLRKQLGLPDLVESATIEEDTMDSVENREKEEFESSNKKFNPFNTLNNIEEDDDDDDEDEEEFVAPSVKNKVEPKEQDEDLNSPIPRMPSRNKSIQDSVMESPSPARNANKNVQINPSDPNVNPRFSPVKKSL